MKEELQGKYIVAVVPGHNEVVDRSFETAAWWRKLELIPGIYRMRPSKGGPDYMLWGSLPGIETDEYFPSLYGGVPIGELRKTGLGQEYSYGFMAYDYQLVDGSWARRERIGPFYVDVLDDCPICWEDGCDAIHCGRDLGEDDVGQRYYCEYSRRTKEKYSDRTHFTFPHHDACGQHHPSDVTCEQHWQHEEVEDRLRRYYGQP